MQRAMAVLMAAVLMLPQTSVLAQGVAPGAGPMPEADPPARVGRVARVSGTVSFHLAGAERWEPAAVNLPVSTGFALWTEPGARAELGIAGDRLVLDQATELDTTRLDDRTAAFALSQGALYWRVRTLPAGEGAGVQTPRGQVSFMQAGRYHVVAGDSVTPTIVSVIEGAADVSGPGIDLHIGPNQAATITGQGGAAFQASLGPVARGAFLTAVLAEEQPPRRTAVAPPPDVARMTGGEALDEYGDWASTPEYGVVWYPPAAAGYVPYRNGHWAFVQPWGWTWVDDAPWGFAPSHYGRWVEVDQRWGWIPGLSSARAGAIPVYAPAVVGFLAGVGTAAMVRGRVGWVPLGPREVYVPPYQASRDYLRRVNASHVPDVAVMAPRPGGPRPPYANRAAATLVAPDAMAGSRGIGPLGQPVPAGAPPGAVLGGRPPMRPSRDTLGVTPAVARQLGLPPAPGGLRPQAPGPALRTGLAPAPRMAPDGSAPRLPQRPDGGAPGPALGAPPAPEAFRPPQATPPVLRPELRPEIRPEFRPQSRPEFRPEPRPGQSGSGRPGVPAPSFPPESRPDARPAAPRREMPRAPTPSPRPEFRPQPPPESRPQFRPEPRPEPRPGPAPEFRHGPPPMQPRPAFQAPRPAPPPPAARPEPPRAPPPHAQAPQPRPGRERNNP